MGSHTTYEKSFCKVRKKMPSKQLKSLNIIATINTYIVFPGYNIMHTLFNLYNSGT